MRNRESGYVLVTVASLLFVLLGFTALAIDMGTILSSRTQLQRAADAAALAGAYTFTVNPNLSDQPLRASEQARATATTNKVMGDAILDAEVSVSIDMPDAPTNKPAQVTVTITRTEPTLFGKVVNVTGVANKVTAIAEAGVQATGGSCVKPFFIPNTALSSQTPCLAAAAGEVLISGGQTTTWVKSKLGVSQYTLKPGSPDEALAPSIFYELDIDKGGGSAYSGNIDHCNTTQFVCQASYDVLTGAKMGPTTAGIKALIGTPPTDTFVGIGLYQDTEGIHDTSRALILAPIADLTAISDFCPAPLGTCTSGNCEQFPSGTGVSVKVSGFASIFIESVSGAGDVVGRLVNVFPCGAAPPSPEAGNGYPVQLYLVRK